MNAGCGKRTLHDLPTPALALDLDVLENNIGAMQRRAGALGVRLRPHVKSHKCVEVAKLQRARGAAGITVSTLAEARMFAEAGFDDILWAFPLNLSRLDEATGLSRRASFGIAVESRAAVAALESAAARMASAGTPPIRVWLEIDCGYGRTGLPGAGEELVQVAAHVAEAPNLALCGCFTHGGHAYQAGSAAAIRAVAEEERRAMVGAGERLRAAGIDPGALSVGSTPGVSHARTLAGIDEARPGNYALYDYTQVSLGSCEVRDCAVSVLSTVVSSAPLGKDRAVADCGALALSKDLGPDDPPHYGRIFASLEAGGLGEDKVVSVSQEHGQVTGAFSVGDKLRILPNHACLTVAHFDYFDVVRGAEVVDRWKIGRERG